MAEDVKITIGAQLDQLESGIARATNTISEMKNAIVTLVAAGGLTLFVDKMAELGEQAEKAADILGVTTVAAQQLGVLAQFSGGSLDEVATQLTRMQVGLERGERLTSQQNAALKALGLTSHQLLATPVDKQFLLFADAIKRLHDQGINAAPALAMISRGLAAMMPELVQGSAAIQEWNRRMIDVGAVVAPDTTKHMAELHRELVLLWDSLKGLGQTIVNAFNPALVDLARGLGNAAGNLAALIATGKLGSTIAEGYSIAIAKVTAWMNSDTEAMKKADEAEVKLGQSIADVTKKYHDMIAAVTAGSLKPIRVDVLGVDKDAMKVADTAFKEQEAIINELAKTFQITELQKTQLLIIEINKRRAAEIAAHEAVSVANAKANLDITRATTQLTETLMKDWKSAADSIAGAFNSQIRGLLAGTTTFAQAMKNVFADLVVQIIQGFVKIAIEWAVQQVFMATVGRSMAAAQAANFVSKLQSDAALVFGGVFANLAPVMGPAAVGPALASQAEVLAQLANIPKYELGVDFVPSDQLAFLHAGERVVPASQNTNNDFGGIHLNVSAVDAASFANLLRRSPNAFNGMIDALAQRQSLHTLTR